MLKSQGFNLNLFAKFLLEVHGFGGTDLQAIWFRSYGYLVSRVRDNTLEGTGVHGTGT